MYRVPRLDQKGRQRPPLTDLEQKQRVFLLRFTEVFDVAAVSVNSQSFLPKYVLLMGLPELPVELRGEILRLWWELGARVADVQFNTLPALFRFQYNLNEPLLWLLYDLCQFYCVAPQTRMPRHPINQFWRYPTHDQLAETQLFVSEAGGDTEIGIKPFYRCPYLTHLTEEIMAVERVALESQASRCRSSLAELGLEPRSFLVLRL